MRTKQKVKELERRIESLEEVLREQNLIGVCHWGPFVPGDCFEDIYNVYRLPIIVECLRHILTHLKLDFKHTKVDKWELTTRRGSDEPPLSV